MLYSFQFDPGTEKELVSFLMQEHKVTKKNALAAYLQAKNIESHQTELDAIITKISTGYDIERIGSCERTILRIALWELVLEKTNPAPCIISEAKRIARKFAGPAAASFLHGLLDAAIRLRG
jgi:N utilization substance protein B